MKTRKQISKELLKGRKLGHTPGCITETATMGKHYKGRSKKHLSEKQKKSLAKGRKVLSYLRAGRTAAEPLEPLLIKEGRFMSKKKSSKKKLIGFEGKTTPQHKKRKFLHGASKDFDVIGVLQDIGGLMVGAIGISFLASLIPIKNPKLKTFLPIAAGMIGLSIPKIVKNRFINRAALGSLAIGSYSLTKQLVPAMPLMGSTDTAEGIGYAIQALPKEEQAILGLTDQTQTTEQTTDYSGNAPGEMLGSSEPGEMLGTELIEGIPEEMIGYEENEMLIGRGSEDDFE